jgi:hypothetical protein
VGKVPNENMFTRIAVALAAVILAAFLVACKTPAPTAQSTGARYLVTPVVGTVGSMAFGNHVETHGMAVLERSSGDVFFCQTRCSKIGNLRPVEGQVLSIHAGASDDFFFTNDTTGDVTSCSANVVNRKNVFVFESGKCETMSLHR